MSFSITPSDIIQYLYCPRFTWFEKVLAIPQFEEKSYKAMRGRNLHDQKTRINVSYLRKKLSVVDKLQEQYLTNTLLRGQVDEVLTLTDGTMAPLDYKFAEYKGKIFSTYKTQLACYAWLVEENFSKKVNRGYLVYARSKNKIVHVEITENLLGEVKNAALEIRKVIELNRFPKATKFKKRCMGCTYSNICIK